MPLEFFQNKGQTGQGRVEGCRQTRAGPGGNQSLALARRDPQPVRHSGAQRAAHLDGRAFPTERQPAPNAYDPTEEFHRKNGLPPHGAEPIEDGFHMRNPAAGRFGGHAVHEANRHTSSECAHQHGQEPAPGRRLMGPENEPGAEEVAPLQGPAKGHGASPRQQPDEEGAREEFAALSLECEIVTHLGAEALQAGGCIPVVRFHRRRSQRSRAPTAQ